MNIVHAKKAVWLMQPKNDPLESVRSETVNLLVSTECEETVSEI